MLAQHLGRLFLLSLPPIFACKLRHKFASASKYIPRCSYCASCVFNRLVVDFIF